MLYNTTSLRLNRDGLASLLGGGVFATPALVPATTWLDGTLPSAPTVVATATASSTPTLRVTVSGDGGKALAWWAVRWRNGTLWSMRLLPSTVRTTDIPGGAGASSTDAVVVHAIDKVGNASAPAVWRAP